MPNSQAVYDIPYRQAVYYMPVRYDATTYNVRHAIYDMPNGLRMQAVYGIIGIPLRQVLYDIPLGHAVCHTT